MSLAHTSTSDTDELEVHEAFLAAHGGERPRTPGSDHHGIALDRIERWSDRWDLLGLS